MLDFHHSTSTLNRASQQLVLRQSMRKFDFDHDGIHDLQFQFKPQTMGSFDKSFFNHCAGTSYSSVLLNNDVYVTFTQKFFDDQR